MKSIKYFSTLLIATFLLASCVYQMVPVPNSNPSQDNASETQDPMRYLEYMATATHSAIGTETARALDPAYVATIKSQQTAIAATAAVSTILYVVLPDGSRFTFTKAEIESLDQISNHLLPYNGVSLLDILNQAGWERFEPVTITLQGKGSLTLQANQVTSDMILYFNDVTSLSFASSTVDDTDWPSDVVLIIVQ